MFLANQTNATVANGTASASAVNGTALSMFKYLSKLKSIYEINRSRQEMTSVQYVLEILKLVLRTPLYVMKSMDSAIRLDRAQMQQEQLGNNGSGSSVNGRSILDSVSQASSADGSGDGAPVPYLLQFEMNYFFSFYSLSCIFSALILARINYMSTTTMRRRRVNLREQAALNRVETYSRLVCHSMIILLLSIMIWHLFGLTSKSDFIFFKSSVFSSGTSGTSGEDDFGLMKLKQQHFLKLCFLAFTASDCISLLINNIYNIKKTPLTASDYTLFDLSLLFYSFDQFSKDSFDPSFFVVILYVLVSHIAIHVLELFKKRNLWFKTSTVLNGGYTGWLLYMLYMGKFHSLPVVIKYTSLPKLTSLFIIVLSSFSFSLTCLVMGFKNLELLQYYKFYKNLKNHLNFTGEEEFNRILLRFALFLTNTEYSQNANILDSDDTVTGNGGAGSGVGHQIKQNNPLLSNDLGDINLVKNLGMLNKIDTIPECVYKDDCGDAENLKNSDANTVILGKLVYMGRLLPIVKLFSKIHTIILAPWRRVSRGNDHEQEPGNGESDKHGGRYGDIGYVNINEMINENNYSRLLINPRIALFPDTDTSGDYDLVENVAHSDSSALEGNETQSEQEEDESELDIAEMKSELADLLHFEELIFDDELENSNSVGEERGKEVAENSDFYYDVLKISMAAKKYSSTMNCKLTRSKYLEINEPEILQSLIQQKRMKGGKHRNSVGQGDHVRFFTHTDTRVGDNEEFGGQSSISDDEDADLQHSCVVCRSTLRSIIFWPCKCLCICDDCRVSLGVRGFNKCPCCRSTVEGFSKINNV